ncbi:hypothetical protein LP417_33035 (plasmid) [Polaromonas sp. P1-6]|nr:hypothetical protein LP417_33035 [Polaromonas sp. P1-6]
MDNVKQTTDSSSPLILALDFDGVIHHSGAAPKMEYSNRMPFDPVKFLADVEADNAATRADAVEAAAKGESELDLAYWYRVGSLFDRMHYLDQLLWQLPQARIVIATAWRETATGCSERLSVTICPAASRRGPRLG